MSLNREMYEKIKVILTGDGFLSPALNAYAEAWFSEPPIKGDWTEQSMQEELYTILWNHHMGNLDIRYRSAESILRERFKKARRHIETIESSYEAISDGYEKMVSFISRYHLQALYDEYVEQILEGEFKTDPFVEELPFV